MPYPESGPCSDCAGEAPTSQDEIVVLSSLVEGCQDYGFLINFSLLFLTNSLHFR